VLFFLSAVATGLAMTIFESTMSARHFGRALEKPIILGLGRLLTLVLIVYAVVRIQDMQHRGALVEAFQPSYEASMFWFEIGLTTILPIAMLLVPAIRNNPMRLYVVSILVVSGFVVNRLNISVTGMERASGVRYIPAWSEIAVTLSIVGIGIFLFTMAIKYLPIFHGQPAPRRPEVPLARSVPQPAG
jgi:Ni/Fe-hydrogenase subunit HybB-like protein